jgi:hypothetical protein
VLHGHRRFAAGLAALAIMTLSWFVIRPATAESPAPAPPLSEVRAAIRADGTTIGGDPAWYVGRPRKGTYVLSFGHDVRLDVHSWDAVATVTARPTTPGTWVVDVVDHGAPVDTTLTLSAVPTAP